MQGFDELKAERKGKITLKSTAFETLQLIAISSAQVTAIRGGDYTNDSEYLRDFIRREQETASALKATIDEGLSSGPNERSLDEIWAAAEARYRLSDG